MLFVTVSVITALHPTWCQRGRTLQVNCRHCCHCLIHLSSHHQMLLKGCTMMSRALLIPARVGVREGGRGGVPTPGLRDVRAGANPASRPATPNNVFHNAATLLSIWPHTRQIDLAVQLFPGVAAAPLILGTIAGCGGRLLADGIMTGWQVGVCVCFVFPLPFLLFFLSRQQPTTPTPTDTPCHAHAPHRPHAHTLQCLPGLAELTSPGFTSRSAALAAASYYALAYGAQLLPPPAAAGLIVTLLVGLCWWWLGVGRLMCCQCVCSIGCQATCCCCFLLLSAADAAPLCL